MGKKPITDDYRRELFPGMSDIPVETDRKIPKDGDETHVDDWVDDMVGVFTDRIVCWPSGVGDIMPEKIRGDITTDRLIQLMRKHKGDPEGEMATWPEVCWYLSSASLEFPFDHDWTQIYLYSFTQYKGAQTPEDLKVDKLHQNQLDDLNRLRSWLYKSRIKARKEKRRGEKRVERDEKRVKKEAEEQEIQNSRLELFQEGGD